MEEGAALQANIDDDALGEAIEPVETTVRLSGNV
jgi:hypothetical protein